MFYCNAVVDFNLNAGKANYAGSEINLKVTMIEPYAIIKSQDVLININYYEN